MERFDGHFAGLGTTIQQPIAPDRDPPGAGDLDPGAGPAQRLARHDRQLSAGRPGREHPEIGECPCHASNQTMRIFLIRMNNTKPPFDNINARKCFAHAFNYAGFIDEILKGYASATRRRCPNNAVGLSRRTSIGYEYDLDKAKDYYQKGGRRRRADEAADRNACAAGRWSRRCRRASCSRADLATVGDQRQDRRRHLRQHDHERRQGRNHARYVGPLGQHLFRRSGELGRPDVRQPVPRHLEGVVLVREPEGGRAAAQGARADRARRNARRSTRRRSGRSSPTARTSGSTTRSSWPAWRTGSRAIRYCPVGSGGEVRWMQPRAA